MLVWSTGGMMTAEKYEPLSVNVEKKYVNTTSEG
jgi:hypothetical protein